MLSFLSRFKRKKPSANTSAVSSRQAQHDTVAHFTQFTQSRVGVEAYFEHATNEQPTTLLLIATTGEWTRRRVPNINEARKIAKTLLIPFYDVNFSGYPQRMRDWNSAQRKKR